MMFLYLCIVILWLWYCDCDCDNVTFLFYRWSTCQGWGVPLEILPQNSLASWGRQRGCKRWKREQFNINHLCPHDCSHPLHYVPMFDKNHIFATEMWTRLSPVCMCTSPPHPSYPPSRGHHGRLWSRSKAPPTHLVCISCEYLHRRVFIKFKI